MSNSGGTISESSLPSTVVTAISKNLGEVGGVVQIQLGKASTFIAKLNSATEFEITEIPLFKENITLWVEPNGKNFSIKGGSFSWVRSEPPFETTGKYQISLFVLESKLYGLAGIIGPEGKAGNTILFGEGAPAEGLGISGNFYIDTASANRNFYGPKVGLVWGSAFALKGEVGPKGEKGEKGEGITLSYLKVVHSIGMSWIPTGEAAIGTAFKAIFRRVVVENTGVLHDISVHNAGTPEGNHNVAIYDCGTAKAKNYTKLWESGSVAASGEKTWQKVADPALSVTAGQYLMFAVMNSTTTHKFGTVSPVNSGATQLPESFIEVDEMLPKTLGNHTFSELKYLSELSEAQVERTSTVGVSIIGRVV